MPDVPGILLQSPLLAAYVKAGFRPWILMPKRDRQVRAVYTALGVRDFVHIEDFDARADFGSLPSLLEGVTTQQELIGIEHAGVRVGRYAASSLLRATRRGHVDLAAGRRVEVERALGQVLDHAHAMTAILDLVRPDAALVLDRGYTPQGPLFDLTLGRGIQTNTWNMAHREDTLMLRRATQATRDEHHTALSDKTWSAVLQADRQTADAWWDSTRSEIRDSYATGSWYSEVGTQFGSRAVSKGELRSELGLDGRPVVGVFPHIFWDATFFWGTDLFGDYERWFVETLKAAYQNTDVTWVVKVHPANLVKNERDGITSEPAEVTAMRSLGPVPDHVRIVPADAGVSTLSLIEAIDFCCTVRGTVGIEAAAMGCSVITAGTGRYDRLGFTHDPSTPAEYLEVLRSLPRLGTPAEAATDRARRYAFAVFLLRPLPLQIIKPAFERDAAATLGVQLVADSWPHVLQSTDVDAVAEWLESGEIDFINRAMLQGGVLDTGRT